jgi:hypothetical protein
VIIRSADPGREEGGETREPLRSETARKIAASRMNTASAACGGVVERLLIDHAAGRAAHAAGWAPFDVRMTMRLSVAATPRRLRSRRLVRSRSFVSSQASSMMWSNRPVTRASLGVAAVVNRHRRARNLSKRVRDLARIKGWDLCAMTIVGVPTEIKDEHRVGLTPPAFGSSSFAAMRMVVQAGVGEGSAIADPDYAAQGATILPDADAVFAETELVV